MIRVLSKKDIKLYEDAIQHILAFVIRAVQIEVLAIGVVLVSTENPCYNDLILIGGVVLAVETFLSVLHHMTKNKIWFRVIVSVLLFAFIDLLLLLLVSRINNWIGVGIVIAINIWMCFAVNKAYDKIAAEKINDSQSIKSKKQATALSIMVALIASVALLDYAEVLRLDGLDAPYTIMTGILAVLGFVLLYYEIAGILHRQIVEEYKEDADVKELLTTYKNGSVFLSYPVTSQAIGDLLDYRILRVRNPKAASLSSDTGAWYTISKSHYDQLVNETDGVDASTVSTE